MGARLYLALDEVVKAGVCSDANRPVGRLSGPIAMVLAGEPVG
jgi:hypothetical protein